MPILFEKIDYVFTTPCCTCQKSSVHHSISYAFNDYIILTNKNGYVIIYDFGNIFQSQLVCKTNQCTILYLSLSHSLPILIYIIKYDNEKAIIVHQSFLESNSTIQKLISINFTDDSNFYITRSTIHNSYFFWNKKKVFYSTNDDEILSEVIINGCQLDYLNNMNENQLKDYYNNLNINYDNITLRTKDIYCLNQTIDYIFITNDGL